MSDDLKKELLNNKCFNVCLQMFLDRGYILFKDYVQKPEEFNFKSSRDDIYATDGKILYRAIFCGLENLSTEEYNILVDETSRLKNYHSGGNKDFENITSFHILYFYYPSKFDFHKKTSIESKTYSNMTLFNMYKWCINPIKHEEQPNFRLIRSNTPEYKDLFSRNKYDKSLLPKICSDDPVTIYYDAKVEDLFEIKRIGEPLTYRIVSLKQINLYKNK